MLAVTFSAFAHAADPADAKPTFLVTEIDVGEGVAIDAATARDVLARRFAKLKDKIEVRSLADVKATVDQTALQQMLGGDDQGQLDKLQEYVAVDRVVFGAIRNVGGVVDVSVKVFNTHEASTEIALSRRLKADAAQSLVLPVLEQLADALTAWTLRTYGLDAPSVAHEALAAKSLKPAQPKTEEAPASSSPWGILSVAGAGVIGAGVGGLGVAGAHIATESAPQPVDLAVLGVGAALVVGGAGLVAFDLLVE